MKKGIKNNVFRVQIKKDYATIETVSDSFTYKFKAGTRPYIVLSYLANKNEEENIFLLCQCIYMATIGTFSDPEYVSSIIGLTSDWVDKTMKKAEKIAKEVTDNDEEMALQEMKNVYKKIEEVK